MGFYSVRLFSPKMRKKWKGKIGVLCGWLGGKHSKDWDAIKTTDMRFDTFRRNHFIKNWELPVSRENSH